MQGLKPADIETFRQLLEQQMDELLQRAQETVSSLTRDEQFAADPLDRATMDSGREDNLRFRERENRLIRKIKNTLLKIEEGTFGICESCGEDIPLPRLKARPVTAYCIGCKTRMENYEKALGI